MEPEHGSTVPRSRSHRSRRSPAVRRHCCVRAAFTQLGRDGTGAGRPGCCRALGGRIFGSERAGVVWRSDQWPLAIYAGRILGDPDQSAAFTVLYVALVFSHFSLVPIFVADGTASTAFEYSSPRSRRRTRVFSRKRVCICPRAAGAHGFAFRYHSQPNPPTRPAPPTFPPLIRSRNPPPFP